MPKNRFFSAAALVAVLGLAACGGGETEETVPVEEQAVPVTTETEQVAPEVTQGTVIMDTTGAGAIVDTSTTVRTDTGGVR